MLTSFHMLIDYPHILFSEMLFISCQISKWIVELKLLLSLESSLYILDTSPLRYKFPNIFTQSVTCLFIALTGLFS